jgi:hypothetical protein
MAVRNGITGLRPASALGWALAVKISMNRRALDHAFHGVRHAPRISLRKKSEDFGGLLLVKSLPQRREGRKESQSWMIHESRMISKLSFSSLRPFAALAALR